MHISISISTECPVTHDVNINLINTYQRRQLSPWPPAASALFSTTKAVQDMPLFQRYITQREFQMHVMLSPNLIYTKC